MRNKYAGTCYRCGRHVVAGEGHFEKITFKNRRTGEVGRWRTQHADCAIYYGGSGLNTAMLPRPTAKQLSQCIQARKDEVRR